MKFPSSLTHCATVLSLLPLLCFALHAETTIEYTGGNPGEDDSNEYVLTDGATFQVNGSSTQNATQSGVISGTGPVTKTGDGVLILTADNLYSGGTTVSAGTLQLGDGQATGSVQGNITISENAKLAFFRSGTVTFAGKIDGAGSLYSSGPNGTDTLILTGNNTFTGGTTIAGTVLQIGDGGESGSIEGNISLSGTLKFNRSDASSFTGTVTGGATVIKEGGGTLTVTGTIFDGLNPSSTTTISAGALQIGDGDTTGSIAGNITNNASLIFNRSDDVDFSYQISGTGSLTKAGAGTLNLLGVTSYSGATTVTGGTLLITHDNVLSDSARLSIADDAKVDFQDHAQSVGSLEGAGNLDLGSGNLTVGGDDTNTTFSGVLSGSGSLTKTGDGTLTLSGANTYSGATTVSAGELSLGADDVLPDAAAFTVASDATADFNDHSDTIGSLAGAGNVSLGSGSLTTGGNNASTTYSGVLSGTGSLIKAGTGTLTLTGDNEYTGSLQINDGTVQIGDGETSGVLKASAVTLGTAETGPWEQNPTLAFNRSNDLAFTGTIDGSHDFDDGEGGTYTEIIGTLSKQGAGTLTFTRSNQEDTDVRINVATLDLQGGTLALDSGLTANVYYNVTLGESPVTLSGGIFNISSPLNVGASFDDFNGFLGTSGAAGDLTLADGVTVNLSGEYLVVGGHGSESGDAGGAGVLTLNAGTTLNVDVDRSVTVGGNGGGGDSGGNGGEGLIELGQGASLDVSGDMYVGGGDGNNEFGSGTPGVGADGAISAASGAHLFVGGSLYIGSNYESGGGGNGTVTLDLATSLEVSGDVVVGGRASDSAGGTGTLTLGDGTDVADQATFTSDSLTVGGEGGTAAGGAGTVALGDYATATVTSGVSLGGQGGRGSDADDLFGGGGPGGAGGAGILSLGAHATLTTEGDVTIGGEGGEADGDVGGVGGAGTLTLGDSASLTVTDAGIQVGGNGSDAAGGDGTLTVGTNAHVSADGLLIGGDNRGGTGTVSLAAGSSLSTLEIYIGQSGSHEQAGASGTLTAASGASVTVSSLSIGGPDTHSEVTGDTTGGDGTFHLGAGTLTVQSYVDPEDSEDVLSPQITITAHGTFNVGYDGTSATAAPTISLDEGATITDDGVINFKHSSGTVTLDASISGEGALNQTGAGTTVLTGDDSEFTGTTTVSAGKLQTNGTLGGSVTVQSGVLGGSGTFSGLVTVESGATVAPGNSPGTLTFDGGLTLNDGAVFNFQLGTISDKIVLTDGELTGPGGFNAITLNLSDAGGFQAGTYTLFDYTAIEGNVSGFDANIFSFGTTITGYTFALSDADGLLQLTATASAVPEPSTYATIVGALALIGALVQRRRATRSHRAAA